MSCKDVRDTSDDKSNSCEEAEEFALIQTTNMPEVINTDISSPPHMEEERKKRSNISACHEFQHGAEAAARKVRQGCCNYWSNTCSLATLRKTLPIIKWLPGYRLKTLKYDFIAGLTVGLTVIPQAMAYAALAGLELQVCYYVMLQQIAKFSSHVPYEHHKDEKCMIPSLILNIFLNSYQIFILFLLILN